MILKIFSMPLNLMTNTFKFITNVTHFFSFLFVSLYNVFRLKFTLQVLNTGTKSPKTIFTLTRRKKNQIEKFLLHNLVLVSYNYNSFGVKGVQN